MSEEEIRELIMMISDLRAKDQEKFEVHIKLMNNVVDYIREFASSMKSKWGDIQEEPQKHHHTKPRITASEYQS